MRNNWFKPIFLEFKTIFGDQSLTAFNTKDLTYNAKFQLLDTSHYFLNKQHYVLF